MRPEDFDPQKIVDCLQGTCDSIQSALDFHYPEMDEEELTEGDHNYMDNEIFLCTQCGWWYEISENADSGDSDLICEGCQEENDENEED